MLDSTFLPFIWVNECLKMKYSITILVRTYSTLFRELSKRRNLDILVIFGNFGHFWPILSANDLVPTGKIVTLKKFDA